MERRSAVFELFFILIVRHFESDTQPYVFFFSQLLLDRQMLFFRSIIKFIHSTAHAKRFSRTQIAWNVWSMCCSEEERVLFSSSLLFISHSNGTHNISVYACIHKCVPQKNIKFHSIFYLILTENCTFKSHFLLPCVTPTAAFFSRDFILGINKILHCYVWWSYHEDALHTT